MQMQTAHPYALGTPLHLSPLSGGKPAQIVFVAGYPGESILLKCLSPIAGQGLVIEVFNLAKLQKTHAIRPATAEDDDLIAGMLNAIWQRKEAIARESGLLESLAERLRTL